MDCELIASNIGDCADKTSLGFDQVAKIGNVSEIATLTYSEDTALVTALAMGAETPCFDVYTRGDKPYGEFKVTAEGKKLGMVFKNDIVLYYKGLTPASANITKILTKGQFFIGLKQKGVTGSAKYMFIGLQAGLHATAAEWDAAEGAWKITLTEDMLDSSVLFLHTGVAGADTEATWTGLTA